jgi:predicted PurR-regulated permease PerM
MTPSLRFAIASWVITAVALVLVLHLHLLAALLAGLLVCELVHMIAPRLPRVPGGLAPKMAAVSLVAAVIVLALVAAMFGVIAFVRSDAGSLPNLLQKMSEILENARGKVPPWALEYMPSDAETLKDVVSLWLKEHAVELRTVGGEVGHTLVHIVIGMVIGAMVSLREALPAGDGGPLARELTERARRVGDAFRRVVFAQVRISAINTGLTALYLIALLPLFGVHLPYAKTLIAVTFFVGLLPVVGNLISNTVILIVSLSISLEVAIASLVFLVVVHKLEYFLNARIVGARIHAAAWELLLAMLVMEAAFGIAGLVAAPIYYAYLKDELTARGLL